MDGEAGLGPRALPEEVKLRYHKLRNGVNVRKRLALCALLQFRIADLRARRQPLDELGTGSQNPEFRRKTIKTDLI